MSGMEQVTYLMLCCKLFPSFQDVSLSVSTKMLHWSVFQELFILLHQALVALKDQQYCPRCLSLSLGRISPLYLPGSPLTDTVLNLDYFNFDTERLTLFEKLIRTIHDTRYFLEVVLFIIQEHKSQIPARIYGTMENPLVEILLELRFGVFYKFVPQRSLWHALTPYGLEVKIRAVQRCFFAPVQQQIHQLLSYYRDTYYPNVFYELVYDYIGLHNYPCSLHQKQPQSSSLTYGPAYPASSIYHTCKICLDTCSSDYRH